MIEIKLEDMFDEYGVYNMSDIVCELDKYLGYGYSDLITKFKVGNKCIVTKDDVIDYCLNNYNQLFESKFISNINMDIIKKRISDYKVFCGRLDIYRYKGLKYLDLLNYLKRLDNGKEIKEYEKLLEQLDISHYKSIVCGRDVVRLLNVLGNTISKYDDTVSVINNMDTYNICNFDSLALSSDELYPRRSLVNDDIYFDRTSICVTDRKRKVRIV